MLELPYIKLKRRKKKGERSASSKKWGWGMLQHHAKCQTLRCNFWGTEGLTVPSRVSTAALCQPSSFCLLLAQLRPVYLFLFLITLPFHELICYLFIFLFNSPIWHVDRLSSAVLSKIRKMMREDDFFLSLFFLFFL